MILGIVEFLEPSEARNAFVKLAYTKFKHLPLYLEWAPDDTFNTEYNLSENKKKNQGNCYYHLSFLFIFLIFILVILNKINSLY